MSHHQLGVMRDENELEESVVRTISKFVKKKKKDQNFSIIPSEACRSSFHRCCFVVLFISFSSLLLCCSFHLLFIVVALLFFSSPFHCCCFVVLFISFSSLLLCCSFHLLFIVVALLFFSSPFHRCCFVVLFISFSSLLLCRSFHILFIVVALSQATAALTRLKPIWIDKSIPLSSKIRLMCSLVTSIFLHACESWTLTAELQRRIQAMEMRCYRKILHISYKAMLPTRKSVPRSSRQLDHMKIS